MPSPSHTTLESPSFKRSPCHQIETVSDINTASPEPSLTVGTALTSKPRPLSPDP